MKKIKIISRIILICIIAIFYFTKSSLAFDDQELIRKFLSREELTQAEVEHLKNDNLSQTFYDATTVDSMKDELKNGYSNIKGNTSSDSNKNNTQSTVDTNSGTTYWHPKNLESQLDYWLSKGKSLSQGDPESIASYLNEANLSSLQALTSSDIDKIVKILDNICANKNTSARPTTQALDTLIKFAAKVQTVNVNGKHVASNSQISSLTKKVENLKELKNASEREEEIDNIVSDANTGAVDTSKIDEINDKYDYQDSDYKVGTTTTDKAESSADHTLGEILTSADGFLNKGESEIDEQKLKTMKDTVYNILLVIAIIVAVFTGAILGIQFIIGGAIAKAQVQQALPPYLIGCAVAFGAFFIWKVVVIILQSSV